MDGLDKLQRALDHRFRDADLLRLALTHPSYAAGHGHEDNQRLEFLGDAVLQVCVSSALYQRFPEMKEGRLTHRRAALVCEQNLAALAASLGIGECLLMSVGEEMIGGRENPSILGDAMEAVIAAVWLDGGYAEADRLIRRLMGDFETAAQLDRDAKSELQELLQAAGEKTPRYEILTEEGPAHARVFTARVLRDGGEEIGRGMGSRKQRAEEAAAEAALRRLREIRADAGAGEERKTPPCD